MIFSFKLELHEAFNLFDRDNSGTISSSELKQVLIALNFNPTDSLLRRVMKEMDTDGMFVFILKYDLDSLFLQVMELVSLCSSEDVYC